MLRSLFQEGTFFNQVENPLLHSLGTYYADIYIQKHVYMSRFTFKVDSDANRSITQTIHVMVYFPTFTIKNQPSM